MRLDPQRRKSGASKRACLLFQYPAIQPRPFRVGTFQTGKAILVRHWLEAFYQDTHN